MPAASARYCKEEDVDICGGGFEEVIMVEYPSASMGLVPSPLTLVMIDNTSRTPSSSDILRLFGSGLTLLSPAYSCMSGGSGSSKSSDESGG